MGVKMQEVNTFRFGLSPCILNDMHLYSEGSLSRFCLSNSICVAFSGSKLDFRLTDRILRHSINI